MSCRNRKFFTDLSNRGKLYRLENCESFSSSSSSSESETECTVPAPSDSPAAPFHYSSLKNPVIGSVHVLESTVSNTTQCNNNELNNLQSSNSSSVEDECDNHHNSVYTSDIQHSSIGSELCVWCVKNKVHLSAFSELLKILNKFGHSNLFTDARALLGTPRSTGICIMPPGEYCHFGVAEQLSLIMKNVTEPVSVISLMVNIDGLPLFKSCSSQVWPILCCITSVPSIKNVVFPVGIYYGPQKPSDPCQFLQRFVNDMKVLQLNMITVKGKKIPVVVDCFVCDRPAEAYILGVKNHSGYSSCTKCIQVGEWSGSHVIFPKIDCTARNHEEFILRTDPAFNTKHTILIDLPGVHFIDSFALDILHLVYLGVVRSMLLNWLFGKPPAKLSAKLIETINNRQSVIEKCIPFEFNRKPRSLSCLKRWKGTEFRLFLLYTGPIVLKGVLEPNKYAHFLTLHVAINILVNSELCTQHVDYAEALLKHFVRSLGILYGKKTITSNAHNLTHFADSVRKHGCAESFSSFKFENHLQLYKALVKTGSKPLQQICRRMHERSSHGVLPTNSMTSFPKLLKLHSSGPLLSFCTDPQYKTVIFKDYKLTCSKPDNCCGLVNGSVIVIFNIAYCRMSQEIVVIGKEFLKKSPLYSVPCESSHLGIFEVSELSSLQFWSLKSICKKFVLFTLNEKNVVFPLIHLYSE